MKAGTRNRKIVIERYGVVSTDDYGGDVLDWTAYATAFAQVIFGTGAERREAAQESATAPATFRVLATTKTRAVTVKDRISFDGSLWDITSVVPLGLNEGVEITAVRKVS